MIPWYPDEYLACYNEGPLVNVIQGYGNRNTYRLEKFLKSLRTSSRGTHTDKESAQDGQTTAKIK
jgi:eukaryotic translation initiation factor 2C